MADYEKICLRKKCPITKGAPSSMTIEGFEKSCGRWRELVEVCEPGTRYYHEYSHYNCPECSGPPSELTFIKLSDYQSKQEERMVAKSRQGKCSDCGGMKTLRPYQKKMICQGCVNVRGLIASNPAAVVKMVEDLAPDALSCDTDALDKLQEKYSVLESEHNELQGSFGALVSEAAPKPFDNTVEIDRVACKDLALRIAVGIISGERVHADLHDVELLRTL